MHKENFVKKKYRFFNTKFDFLAFLPFYCLVKLIGWSRLPIIKFHHLTFRFLKHFDIFKTNESFMNDLVRRRDYFKSDSIFRSIKPCILRKIYCTDG